MRILKLSILLAVWLGAVGPVSGQMSPIPGFPPGAFQSRAALDAGSAGGCSQATTFLARTSGLSGTETTAYTNLICGLVTDGIITGTLSGAAACGTKLDALWIFATNTTTTANLNLCGTSATVTINGAPTFSTDLGYTTDAAGNNTLNSNFTASTAGGNMALNSAHVSAWNITGGAGSSDRLIGNNVATSNRVTLRPLDGTSNTGFTINNNTQDAVAGSVRNGHFLSNRSGASALQIYLNGASLGTGSSASVALTDQALQFGGDSTGGNGCACQIASASAGASLSSTDAANLYSRLRTYMTAVGVP
ncbi:MULTISPECIES: hypothetical protein [Bradyrhizobium]|uniref:Uncharacterized protein n=2 Tax=Bradyrhizobium TaxID=374 RepID=A0ABY0Q6T7_9BRAD|nr:MULTISPECIES: hypothetical protein [Bradyrhizobium]SDJ61775.1 hypothetical protein SAMN05444163_5935 [Bradyrhizobium ottawaense]SEC35778.1 hypothetical protein SAMN05444171_1222 [Bradyrhizobium lablabi]SHK61749.1 hypothetical protein SAMN05444321_0061 [Bradyrhizobium lablabi]